jgi:hypothetical protein
LDAGYANAMRCKLMKRTCVKLFFTIVSLLICSVVLGQEVLVDSSFVSQSVAAAVELYSSSVRNQSMLYNGGEYDPYPEPYNDHPYFASEYWEEGSVHYYEEWYHDVSMQYDILRDELVIEHYGQSGFMAEVKLHSDKVDSFELLGHTFIRISGDSTEGGGLRAGFYDLLYNGGIKILCRRKKSVVKNVESATLSISFDEKDSYFLIKDGSAFQVRNRATMLKALKDEKKVLNQAARKGRLDFVHQREFSIIEMANYYDDLSRKSAP